MTFRQVLKKEFFLFLQQRAAISWLLIAMPIVYTLLFGAIYSLNAVENIPTVIFDQDQTSTSRALVAAYSDSDRFEIVAHAQNEDELVEALNKQEAQVGLYIPFDFAREVKRGLQPNLGIFVNSTNIVFGNSALASAKEINLSVMVKTAVKFNESLGLPPAEAFRTAYPVQMKTRLLNNPTNSYSNFMLVGLIANGIQLAIFLVVPTLLCREYKQILKWQKTTTAAMVFGKMLPSWIVITLVFFFCEYLAYSIFGVPFRAPIWQIAVFTATFTFLFTSLCILFSAIFPNAVMAMQAPLIYVMPGLLFSGLSWPLAWMNNALGFWAKFLPLTYFALPLRDLTLRGYSLDFVNNLLFMLIAGSIFLILTCFIFALQRRRFERKEQAVLS